MVIFKEVLEKCKAVIPSNVQFEGMLAMTILQKEEDVEWRSIVQVSQSDDFKYYKITRLRKGETTLEQTNLPFGYSPFDEVKIELAQAIVAAKAKNGKDSKVFKLYFPLSPFDTEPLWFFTFENGNQITVAAHSGEVQEIFR